MLPDSETTKSQEPIIAGLVRKVINGDVEAYGQLYDVCFDRIYRYIFNQVGDQMLAEDIAEEVFFKVWKSIKSCKGKERTFIPWLYRIAHNQTIDTLRRTTPHLTLDETNLPEDSDPAEIAESSLEWQQVLQVIAGLPEEQRRIIILKFLDGSDNSEIEKITGKQQGAIRVLQMRALMNIKKRLKIRGKNDDE
jgi:RNA polymerase sigma-70 factor, ECF subfamily